MMAMGKVLLACLACHSLLPAAEAALLAQSSSSQANPIRKVVTMMQSMQKKIEKEGEAEKKLFDDFMCYCDSNLGKFQKTVADAEARVPVLSSEIKAAESKKAELEEDLKEARASRVAAEAALKEGKAKREKEKDSFEKMESDAKSDIELMNHVEAELEGGSGASFLQTQSAAKLRKLVEARQNMDEDDRNQMLSFLSSNAGSPDMINGMLQEMEHEETEMLGEATKEELAAVKAELKLEKAKNKEIKALSMAIERKTKLAGELGIEISQQKADLEDTSERLAEDKKYLNTLETGCKTKSAEWEERQKTRAEELAALSDTIAFLNSDDALELFKKTLPSKEKSFLQMASTSSSLKQRARQLLNKDAAKLSRAHRVRLDLLSLALRGKKVGFEAVLKKVDEMTRMLGKEQDADDEKKASCGARLDQAEDERKDLEREISDIKAEKAEHEDSLDTTQDNMKALEESLASGKEAAEAATDERKKEHAEFKELIASDSAAKDLLGMAKSRLSKFYHPKEEEAFVQDEADSFVQVSAHARLRSTDPPPPPPTFESDYKKSESNHGVIGMISTMIAELDKEMAEAKVEEKNSQKEYEETLQDLKEKRKEDSKALVKSEESRSAHNAALHESKEELSASSKELAMKNEYEATVHRECDWLLQNYDVRKEARAAEKDSMKRAKAVLSGADFSLLQTASMGSLRR